MKNIFKQKKITHLLVVFLLTGSLFLVAIAATGPVFTTSSNSNGYSVIDYMINQETCLNCGECVLYSNDKIYLDSTSQTAKFFNGYNNYDILKGVPVNMITYYDSELDQDILDAIDACPAQAIYYCAY